jgi:hypothetical protein
MTINILHVSKLEKNELEITLKASGLEEEILDQFQITVVNEVPYDIAYEDYDLIFIGMCDGGVNLFKKCKFNDIEYSQLEELVKAKEAGIHIIFTHDCLEPVTYAEHLPDNYGDLIAKFGMDSYKNDESYAHPKYFTSIKLINKNHPIVRSYFELPVGIIIQRTHCDGLFLSDDVKIIYQNANLPSSLENYYLAVYEKEDEGKVAFCQMGHNRADWNNYFNVPPEEECKILTNVIIWMLD